MYSKKHTWVTANQHIKSDPKSSCQIVSSFNKFCKIRHSLFDINQKFIKGNKDGKALFNAYYFHCFWLHTAQKMKFSIKDFFSKCDQIRRKLRIWSHLLKKSLKENFIFCAVTYQHRFMIKHLLPKFSHLSIKNNCRV